MTGHWVTLEDMERLLSLRGGNEGKHVSKTVQRTFNNAAHFRMLKSICLWIPNEKAYNGCSKELQDSFRHVTEADQ